MRDSCIQLGRLFALSLLIVCVHGDAESVTDTGTDQVNKASYEIPYEPQILQYGLENLNYLKRAIPDLHSTVISTEWETMDGLEQLKVVANHTLVSLGASREDLDDYIGRIDDYESSVPQSKKENLYGTFASFSETLLREIMYFELDTDGIEVLIDAYSIIWEDSPPDRLSTFEECLYESSNHMKSNLVNIFEQWLENMEEIPINADLLVPHVRLRGNTISELNDNRLDSLKIREKCDQDSVEGED